MKRIRPQCNDDIRGTFLDPHRKKTINRVTQRLAPAVRDAIRTLWKTAGVMDLNYPDLSSYLSVINSRFERANKENAYRKEQLEAIAKMASEAAKFYA